MNKMKMWKIPQYGEIPLGFKKNKKVVLMPLEDSLVVEIKEKFLEDSSFTVRVNQYIIADNDIILFGDADTHSPRVATKLDSIILSKEGVLAIPAPINTKDLTQGSKIVPGVSAIKYYEYALCQIGMPKNVIIFTV